VGSLVSKYRSGLRADHRVMLLVEDMTMRRLGRPTVPIANLILR